MAHARLLTLPAVASVVAFVGMVAYDPTAPPADQWLLVYAGVGLPFPILILVLPLVNSRIIHSIPDTTTQTVRHFK